MTTIATLPVLADGSTGPDVKWAQYLLVLKTLDYTDVDGIFGPKTDNAVRVFQGFSGLTVDGNVDPHTWAAVHGRKPRPPMAPFTRSSERTRHPTGPTTAA